MKSSSCNVPVLENVALVQNSESKLSQREKVESFRLRVFKTKLYATDATVVVLNTYI